MERPITGEALFDTGLVCQLSNPLFHVRVDIDGADEVIVFVPVGRGVRAEQFLHFEVGHGLKVKLCKVGLHPECAACSGGDVLVGDDGFEGVESGMLVDVEGREAVLR